MAEKGKLYGIGVGPGDSELVTKIFKRKRQHCIVNCKAYT